LETHAGQTLDLALIERDVRRLWTTGWFDDIRVETSDGAQGVRVTFTLAEKPRLYLRRVKVRGGGVRRPSDLKKGAPVDRVWAKRVSGEIQRQWVEEGYRDARVEGDLIPVGDHQADLRLRVERGRLYRVAALRFSGSLGLKPKEARKALRETYPRRWLPGLGRSWSGWPSLAPLSHQRLQADVDRLRSMYFSRGYFEARVEIANVDIKEDKATVTLDVNSGRRHRVGRLEVREAGTNREISAGPDGEFPSRQLCRCLLEARRKSEKRGELFFGPRLQVAPAAEPPRTMLPIEPRRRRPIEGQAIADPRVDLRAEIETGPAYRIARIEFGGNYKVSDSTLRRALLLREGDLFDRGLLRRSLARLSQLPFVEPVKVSDAQVELAPESHLAKLTIPIKEKARGRWSLSGPLGPLGPFEYMIGARLPARGSGVLELSTYYAAFSLFAPPAPFAGLWPPRWTIGQPVAAFERPYLPGQDWKSGFLLSPQLGWRGALAGYGLTQANRAAHFPLEANSWLAPDLAVPVSWRAGRAADPGSVPASGVLQCEAPQATWGRLRRTGALIADVAASWWVLRLL